MRSLSKGLVLRRLHRFLFEKAACTSGSTLSGIFSLQNLKQLPKVLAFPTLTCLFLRIFERKHDVTKIIPQMAVVFFSWWCIYHGIIKSVKQITQRKNKDKRRRSCSDFNCETSSFENGRIIMKYIFAKWTSSSPKRRDHFKRKGIIWTNQ